ncbi:MOSC domain-containing protein [Virgibacillus halodenitrificans]|uniref:MOSC domain-containing protein n=1 Tax=Virgibacillus halodenitrificans TaxID=1482 RepID=UPI0009E674A8|nr:MOSC domain-containing protein [Virgibacillus halodenitrificans]MCG1027976.1 MOSC domain-containing protein [Virgibacillus halodenitrificans]MYL45557.1 MOSC domain-containing protein [Virgibacillus halodenitrificans]
MKVGDTVEEPHVHKIFTGKVKRIGTENASNPMERPWESGMFKQAVDDKVWLTKTGFTGDEVADTKNHGGPEKAVFAYPIKHYTSWKEELDLESIDMSAMGENMAVLEMDEFSVCIGDTYELGDAVIQVSQPRQPCWKPARRFGIVDLALRIQNSGRTGWYFRVVKEGYVTPGTDLKLIERPYPQWSIAACNEVMHIYKDDLRTAEELASCDLLAINWRKTLKKRLRGQSANVAKRVFGPNKEA